jgi:septal ring factor EnvC (AmiA/AmiB activator)
MDDKDYVTRFEYDERQKRIDDENNRQNHRLDKLETITDQIADMAASIKAMVVTMQAMQKEQEEQGKRLTDIEKKPADNWDKLVYSLIAMVASAAVTYILAKGGL